MRKLIAAMAVGVALAYSCEVAQPYPENPASTSNDADSNPIGIYSMIIQKNPKDDHAYYCRGMEYIRQGKLVEAKNDLDKAVAINPKNNGYHLFRGYLYDLMGDSVKADKIFASVIDINPDLEWTIAFSRGGVLKNKPECTLPMVNQGGVWVIPVTINDCPDIFHFMVDTGGFTTLTPRIAQMLHLEDKSRMFNGPQGIKVKGVSIDRLIIGDWVFTGIIANILETHEFPVDGIIGANILNKCIVTIDGQKSAMTISEQPCSVDNSFECGINTPVDALFKPILKAVVSGRDQVELIVDTGFQGGIVLPDKIDSSGLAPEGDNGISMKFRFRDTQEYKIYPKVLNHMSIGSLHMVDIYLGRGGQFGVIGNSFLRNFKVKVDYIHHKLILSPYQRPIVLDKSWYHEIRGNGFCSDAKFEDALGEYNQALDENPDCFEPYYYSGRIYLTQGKYAEAIKYLTSALERSPRLVRLLKLRAQAYYQSGNWTLGMADDLQAEKISQEGKQDHENPTPVSP